MSTHCQLFAHPQSIHRQFIANRVRIQFKSIVNPCQYKSTLMPIHCQFAANSGQPTSDAAQMQPIYRSDFPMPIRDQSANPEKICQFIPFFPIHCRSDGNPDPIENQSMVNPVPIKVNPPPIQCQSVGNLDQSIRQSINSIQ